MLGPQPTDSSTTRSSPSSTSSGPNAHEDLNRPELRAEAAQAPRARIEEVRLIPEDGRLAIELVGDLAALLNLASGNKKPVTRDRDGLQLMLCGARN